jgi:hypothetical protein
MNSSLKNRLTSNSSNMNEETKSLNDNASNSKEIEHDNDDEVKRKRNDSGKFKQILEWSLKYLISLFLGILFGFAMEKAKVYEPKAIRQQMIFKRFIMLKMFLAAFATSTLSILLVALIFKKR